MMKSLFCAALFCLTTIHSANAALQEVMKEATGSGPTQQQAIAEALLIAAQSVNGTSVSSRTDLAEEVNMVVSNNHWSYQGKTSPVFSVETQGTNAINRFQVLSVSGSGKNYRAKVRAYVSKFQSSVADQHLRRIAVMPFQYNYAKTQITDGSDADDFVTEVADLVGTQLANSRQLSLVSRDYIEEMASENAFLRWDGAPAEMARLGQKVGADYILVGRINEAKTTQGRSFYGAVPAGQQAIRLNWRVIEVNTGKVAAAGTVNQQQRQSLGDLIHSAQPATSSDLLAQQISNEVLSGLSLTPVNYSSQGTNQIESSEPLSDADLTPGSSEKPVRW